MNSRLPPRDGTRRLGAQCLLLALGACGAEGATATSVPATLKVCMKIARDSERLQCYDRAVAALDTGGTGTEGTIGPEEVFGAKGSGSARRADAAAPEREELDSITSTVRSVSSIGPGLLELELDNGQVWLQQEAKSLKIDVGDRVTVTRAALGTFRVVDTRGRFARFTRIR